MKGSKRQRKPGRWELRVYVGVDADGKPVQRSRTVRGSAREADKALRAFVDEVEQGMHDPRPPVGTVAEMLERWLTAGARDWQPRTTSDNRWFVEKHLIPEIGDKDAARVKASDLDDLYGKLADTVGVPTARRAHTHLSSAFSEAVRSDRLMRSPAERARPPKPLPKPERDVSLGMVLAVQAEAVRRKDLRMAALIHLALATGARRGELLGLQWWDIEFDNAVIVFRRAIGDADGDRHVKGLKRGEKPKRVAVDDDTLDVLRGWRSECDRQFMLIGATVLPTWWLWPIDEGETAWSPGALSARWAKLCKAAGVEMRFHDIRHAHGSFLVSSGVPPAEVAKRLGHSIGTLQRTYLHPETGSERGIAAMTGRGIAEAREALPKTPTAPPTEAEGASPLSVGLSACAPPGT